MVDGRLAQESAAKRQVAYLNYVLGVDLASREYRANDAT